MNVVRRLITIFISMITPNANARIKLLLKEFVSIYISYTENEHVSADVLHILWLSFSYKRVWELSIEPTTTITMTMKAIVSMDKRRK